MRRARPRQGVGPDPRQKARTEPRRPDQRRPDQRRATTAQQVELMFLPGLEGVVRDEIAHVLPGVRAVWQVPGRDDSLGLRLPGELRTVLALRTVVAPFLLLSLDVTNPKQLLAGENFPTVVDALRRAIGAAPRRRPRSLRIDAAGAGSGPLTKLAEQLGAATGLRHDPEDGECVIRLRRTPESSGWDVLIRLGNRPLSARPWRVADHPAAANATIAAAMVRLSAPHDDERVANPMCGSGTLLIERLLARPAARAVGCDIDPGAIAMAGRNLAAAGLAGRADLRATGIEDDDWLSGGPYDVLFADPPWGDKTGHHDTNEELHATLLRRTGQAARRGARLVVLTHEVKIMTRCLRLAADTWRPVSETRVFQKGHHPRIYVLDRL
jgi:tRNA (guanine6-N2)-methyltransferase